MNLNIYHTNDIHSHLEEFAKIATIIKNQKSNDDLLVDAGDFNDFMRLEINGTNGEAGMRLLSALNYDGLSIGNNEGFAGVDALKTMANTGNVPLLSCNLYLKNLDPIKGVKRSRVITRNGIRVLIIGATPMFNEFFELLGLHSNDIVSEIKKEMLDNKSKYDLCILLSHLGYWKDCDLAEMDLGIDVIIGGHSHTEMEQAVKIKNTIIHQSGKHGELLGKLSLCIEDDKIISFTSEDIKTGSAAQDEEILNIIKEQKEIAVKNFSVTLFNIQETLWHDVIMENPLTNLICDAFYKYFPCDFAIMNSGIFNCGIKGNVTKIKLLQVSPSPLNPTYVTIKGDNILKALIQTLDGDICLNGGRGAGFRGRFVGRLHVSKNVLIIVRENDLEVTIDGKALDLEKEYNVVTSDYLQRGTGYSSLFSDKNVLYEKDYIRDVLLLALKDEELIKGCFENRFFAEQDKIIIKKLNNLRHKTLKERLEGFEGEYVFEEWDTGKPVGKEVL